MLTLDTYNGNRAAAESYRQITGVSSPMLQNASNGTDYAGARLEDIVVVDQTGIVRYWTNATSDVDYPRINNMVDALINQSPVITLSLRQIFFGTTLEVGQSKTVNLVLDNTGAGSLDITGYTAPEGIVMEPSSLTIGIGESKTVQLTLTPTQTGSYSGNIVLQHGDQSVGTLSVPINTLTIEPGQFPTIALAQQSLSVGEIEVGKSIEQTFTITNSGPGPLNVTNIQSSIPGLTLAETQFTVAAGQSKDITVTFNPQTEGAITGTIDVISNDPSNGTISLSLTGSAIIIPADPRTDFNGSGVVDFPDFLSFVQAFGTADANFDLNGSGTVDFVDFLTFAANFGKSVN